MKNMKRALRRHHYFRLKKYRQHFDYYQSLDTDKVDHTSGIRASTACRCSCHMCGNPRKYYDEITLQEKKSIDWKNGKEDSRY